MSPRQAFVRNAVRPLDDAATVDDDRLCHRVERLVECCKLVPVRDDDRAVGVAQRVGRAVRVGEVREPLAHRRSRDGIVRDDVRCPLLESLDDRDRPGVSDVVGPRLECEAEDGDALAGRVDVVVQQREESVGLAVVDRERGFEHLWGVVGRVCHGDDRRHVLFETAPSKSHATPEEAFADPVVEADGLGDLVGVDTVLLADRGR